MFRVTEILDAATEPELLSWMLRTPAAKRKAIQEEALRVGSLVDRVIGANIRFGGEIVKEGDEAIVNCFNAWDKFKLANEWFVPGVKDMQIELVDGELVGHPDFIVEKNGGWGVVDLKCSSSIRPKYWTQTAKYGDMYSRLLRAGLLPDFIAILRLDKKTAEFEYKEVADPDFIKYQINVFEAYRTIFDHAFNTREVLRQQLEKEI